MFNSAKTPPLHDRNGAGNLALLRRLAVSLLRQDTKTKVGKGSKTKDSEQQPTPTTSSHYSQTPSFSALVLLVCSVSGVAEVVAAFVGEEFGDE